MASHKTGARPIVPRTIRLRDVPAYVGMDRNRFNKDVRPYLTEIPIGEQGIGFDRLELDRWVDEYIARNGRPARKGTGLWDAKQCLASQNEVGSGTSTRRSSGGAFARALEQVARKRRNNTSHD